MGGFERRIYEQALNAFITKALRTLRGTKQSDCATSKNSLHPRPKRTPASGGHLQYFSSLRLKNTVENTSHCYEPD